MLHELTILDTTRLLPGPYATWLLTRMGANVIKVERPGQGDYLRLAYPRRGGTSTAFHLYNEGKRSVALDLRHDDGRAAFMDLVGIADVVLDGNRPGVLDRLGCGWDACRARKPSVIFGAITGFGQSGPYRGRAAHDLNALAYSGALSGFADEAGKPVAPTVPVADMASGLLLVAAILATLPTAQETGRGRFVDVSMADVMISMQGFRLARELFPGEPAPAGDAQPGGDTNELGVYETLDGRYVALDPYEPRAKDALWDVIEREGCGRRPSRRGGPEAVKRALADAIVERPLTRWDTLLRDLDVCYAPVLAPSELHEDPQLRSRGVLGTGMDPGEASPSLGTPVRFTPSSGGSPQRSAPRLGEHTDEVLAFAGWTPERIVEARRRGAIASY